jgi:Domain of unknown function (DUF4347)
MQEAFCGDEIVLTLQRTTSNLSNLSNPSTDRPIVFIDCAIPDYATLAEGVVPGCIPVLLDPSKDGIEQIAERLEQESDITSIHIVCHAVPGCLYLGSTRLTVKTLDRYTQQLHNWICRLKRPSQTSTVYRVPATPCACSLFPMPPAPPPPLLLYGCQIAAGEVGRAFVRKLQHLTGMAIAASSSLTGSAALGGNWDLEVRMGSVHAPPVFTAQARETYAGVLAAVS